MKRTDLERRERELKRVEKREAVAQRRTSGEKPASVGEMIEELFSLFRYDTEEIFNTMDDLAILEFIEKLKDEQPEKQWDNILRKAIKKTKIAKKDKAFDELRDLM